MEKINNFIDKLLNIAPGGFYGLIAMVIGTSFIFIAYFQVPGYSMFESYISLLGIMPLNISLIFNIGLILAGIIAVPFFIYLGRVLDREGLNEKMRDQTVKISVIGCLSLSAVGCLPAYNIVIGILHASFAMVFFFGGIGFCILFSILMWEDPRFAKYQSYIGFIVAGVFGAFIFTGVPIFEWAIFFAIVFWIIENSIYTLIIKKRLE